jgi:hypothetical protein
MDYPTREEIRSLCTEQSFERGVDYYDRGQVLELDIDGGEIEATVRGTHDYEVVVDAGRDPIYTYCSCPYDYAGDCKHVVAVLLAVEDREPDTAGDEAAEASDRDPSGPADVEELIERTTAEDLREFLLEVVEDDRDVRDRFVAFAGEDTGKTVYDYKREIDRLFEDAAGRRGMIEYDTRVDLSKYHDLAETHRERGRVGDATAIYRALAGTIRENMNRIDDSSGHHGRELERAVESYAETIAEQDLDHEAKRSYIEYLLGEFVGADYGFVRDDYDDALRTLCTTRADLEYWLDLLDEHVSGVSLDPTAIEARTTSRTDETRAAADTERRGEKTDGERRRDEETDEDRESTDDVLYTSDFTDGPLTTDDFTGGTLDVEHLGVGPLKLAYFAGDAFEDLRVDDPTTVEEHTVDVEPTESDPAEAGIASSLRTRHLLSTYMYLLEELGEEEALSALYERVYLESSRFCRQYAERLIEEGDEERAIGVVEDGIDTFRSTTSLEWLAADLYRDRDPETYRETLKRLFLDHTEWDAYDELKQACDDRQWDSIYEEFERHLDGKNRRRLIELYIHEGELRKAFSEVVDSENLSWVRRYRDPVATVDPAEYFEAYRELLVPFAAGETGRRHYREVADHLEEMRGLVPEERVEEFVDFLKEEHSNRPAFLDELEKAGF